MDKDPESGGRYVGKYPTRLPVWWGRSGPAGPHPELDGIQGQRVTIRFLKRFNWFERMLHRLLGGSKEIRRPFDDLNSLLWELCDGSRIFLEIVELLDVTFQERIAPARLRTEAALRQFEHLGLICVLSEPFQHKWSIAPEEDPSGKLGPWVRVQDPDVEAPQPAHVGTDE